MLKPIIKSFSNELHSLRGLAAVTVLFCHLNGVLNEILNSSFFNIFNGSACVVLFFVLSGLVVTSSILKSEEAPHFLAIYYIKRLFRLMPLMLVTVTIGGVYIMVYKFDLPLSLYKREWGEFSYQTWFAGYFGYSLKANPPSWSIWIELVASIALPAFVLIRKESKDLLFFGIALLSITFLNIKTHHYWHFYLFSFYLGATVLYWGKSFTLYFCDQINNKFLFNLVIFILFILFYLPRIFLNNYTWFGNNIIVLWESFTIAPLIALIYYNPDKFNILKSDFLIYLGNISFSIYLNHMILMVIFYNIYLANFQVNTWIVLGLAPVYLIFVLFTSHLTHKYVELNGASLGQKMLSKLGLAK